MLLAGLGQCLNGRSLHYFKDVGTLGSQIMYQEIFGSIFPTKLADAGMDSACTHLRRREIVGLPNDVQRNCLHEMLSRSFFL